MTLLTYRGGSGQRPVSIFAALFWLLLRIASILTDSSQIPKPQAAGSDPAGPAIFRSLGNTRTLLCFHGFLHIQPFEIVFVGLWGY